MTPDDPRGTKGNRAWSLVFGIGWLTAIAVTMYLTRGLDPRSWVPSVDRFDLPALPGYLQWVFGPWRFVALAVVVGLVTESRRRKRSRDVEDIDAPPAEDTGTDPEPPSEK